MTAYYNEIDPYAAQWLRNLIAAGHIAPGDVDERSIEDVNPDDLKPYVQCHFFAGIGVWSHALRRAGWEDDWPVWTGSCPCQPFSAAGKGGGFADERHLWPAWHHLIGERRPSVIFGEQVASKDGLGWLDLIQADLEGSGYACGPVDLCAAGVGAPHIRQRLWFTAERLDDDDDARCCGTIVGPEGSARDKARLRLSGSGRGLGRLASADDPERGPDAPRGDLGNRSDAGWPQGPGDAKGHSGIGGLADDEFNNHRSKVETPDIGEQKALGPADRTSGHSSASGGLPGPVNGFWGASDWLFCRDDKWRPVEPSYVEMVDVTPTGVGHVCSDGENSKEAVTHGLPDLRGDALPKNVSALGPDGIPEQLLQAQVLRPEVHGGSHVEGPLPQLEPQSIKGEKARIKGVRGLRIDGEPSRSPQGREPSQQRPVELENLVRFLPSYVALADARSDHATSKALQILHETICTERSVRNPSHSAQEIWASLGEESQNRIRVGFDASRWRLVAPFPLSGDREVNRVGRLRAYGNAIVAEAAEAVISSYLDLRADEFA